jgi:excisionase family DNA binding protein
MIPEPLVNISEASQILGVSEAALRQWTDEGKIKAFITPGGHRRYMKSELKKLMSSHQKILGIKDLATKLEDTVQIHRQVDMTFLSTTSWYNRLSKESQRQLATFGRQMLQLIIRYIAEPPKRDEVEKLACDAGSRFGETLATLDLPLTDAVQAFILHRDPVLNVVTQLMKKREASLERISAAIPLVNHIMDKILVSLMTAHQQNNSILQSQNGREAAR